MLGVLYLYSINTDILVGIISYSFHFLGGRLCTLSVKALQNLLLCAISYNYMKSRNYFKMKYLIKKYIDPSYILCITDYCLKMSLLGEILFISLDILKYVDELFYKCSQHILTSINNYHFPHIFSH